MEIAANLKKRSYMKHLVLDIQSGFYGFEKDMKKVNYYLNEASKLSYFGEDFFIGKQLVMLF
jgi:hypothetical protein